MIKAYKLYTGPDGHSHFEVGSVADEVITEAIAIKFRETPPHATLDWHTAPDTQYVLCLNGSLQFTVHSGATFILKPGEVLIAMDTTGSGHEWHMVDDEPWKRAYVVFEKGAVINFVPDEATVAE